MKSLKKCVAVIATLAMAGVLSACQTVGKSPQNSSESVVLINAFEVPKGKEAEALASWQKSADFLKTQDGYISTRLHQNLDPNGKFHLVNVAVWRSADDFKRATAKMRETMPDNQVEGVKFTPSLFRVIKSD